MSATREGLSLILWRHAEAQDGTPDAARRLTDRGEKQAQRIAEWLAARLPRHYRLVCSPAMRAQQTARALQRDFVTDARIAVGGGPGDVLAAADWKSASGTVIVVGHQPTLGRTAALLLCGSAQDWSIKKGAVWWIERRPDEIVLRAVTSPSLA